MTNQNSSKPSLIRRTLAGVVAAGAIALGGAGWVTSADAAEAGVRTQNYVVQSATVQVQAPSVTGTPKRSL